MRALMIISLAALVSACGQPSYTPIRADYRTSIENAEVQITAGLDTARAIVTERGEPMGDNRRVVLTEMEVGSVTGCGSVNLFSQTSEIIGDVTTSTLFFELENCPVLPIR